MTTNRADTNRPFFLADRFWFEVAKSVALQDVVVQTVTGLGYDLVELERSAGGLLRITIDHPWTLGEVPVFITVEDCEKVTRQLHFVLEAEEVEYRRLEVSSPGIDRPLRHQADFERFAGEVVDVTLKAPIGAAAGTQVSALRKKFRGLLEKADQPGHWQIVWRDEAPTKPGQRVSHKRVMPPAQVLGFALDELREARLAPIVDFKGRQARSV